MANRDPSWLFDTKPGDLVCAMIERLTGCALVPLADLGLDDKVEATARGKAAATSRAPSGD